MEINKFLGEGLQYEGAASGRMDVMGGIADYSGSLLLQKAISQKTTTTLSIRNDGLVKVYSNNAKVMGAEECYESQWIDIYKESDSYAEMGQKISRSKSLSWATYVVGCIVVLVREKELKFQGANIWVDSEVPFGKGVSSSAAIEVATMKAFQKAYALKMEDIELSVLAQKVENLVVGAPCGLMDQLACNLADTQSLLPLICQPHQVMSSISIPTPLRFVGIDSGVRHSVGGSSYGDVRIAAFMGYTIIAKACGASENDIEYAKKNNDFNLLPYKGYLSNISVSEFETYFKHLLPTEILGSDFLKQHSAYLDKVTSIHPQTIYKIQVCTHHPIYEHHRVSLFSSLLQSLSLVKDHPEEMKKIYSLMGELMYQSHASYSACGLGSEATDEIVEAVRAMSLQTGMYGAKITGGGSGGTVCVLCSSEDAVSALKAYFKQYQSKHSLYGLAFFE
jgi:L-arabinokinase